MTSFGYTGKIVTYIVQASGLYDILALGAAGGGDIEPRGSMGGRGAEIGGEVRLTRGEMLSIAVGGKGADGLQTGGTQAGGGGGGSFVVGPDDTPLMIAGGGGGGSMSLTSGPGTGGDGQTGTAGVGGNGGTTSYGGADGSGGGGYFYGGGGGGGGFQGSGSEGGPSGSGGGGYPSLGGGSGFKSDWGGSGGFGGGGGGGGGYVNSFGFYFGGGGGGGGYSGGGGSYYDNTDGKGFDNTGGKGILNRPADGGNSYGPGGGGGGGSFNSGTQQVLIAGFNAGNGTVTIQLVDSVLSIAGVQPSASISDAASIRPFAAARIMGVPPTQDVTVTLTLSDTSNGRLSQLGRGTLSGGSYRVTGTAAQDTAAINGLVFTPVRHEVAPGQTIATTITGTVADAAGKQDFATRLDVTAANDPPTITGTKGHQVTSADKPVQPFATTVVTDTDRGVSDSLVIVLRTATGAPTDSNGVLSGTGLSRTGSGTYQLAAASPVTLSRELRALVFTPARHDAVPGHDVTTRFELVVSQTAGGSTTSVTNTDTSVILATAWRVTGPGSSPGRMGFIIAHPARNVGDAGLPSLREATAMASWSDTTLGRGGLLAITHQAGGGNHMMAAAGSRSEVIALLTGAIHSGLASHHPLLV